MKKCLKEKTNNSKTKEDEFIDKKLKEVHNASILKMKKKYQKTYKDILQLHLDHFNEFFSLVILKTSDTAL